MPRIFISYRRDDSKATAGRLYDHLETAFGKDNLFMDVDDIPPGVDFRTFLQEAIAEADIVLIIMGPKWAPILKQRRKDINDFVRIELESTLEQRKITIPVLVDGARMPLPSDLPERVAQVFLYLNAVTLSDGATFRRDVDRLIAQLNHAESLKPPPPLQSQNLTLPSNTGTLLPKSRLLLGFSLLAIMILVGLLVAQSMNLNNATTLTTVAQKLSLTPDNLSTVTVALTKPPTIVATITLATSTPSATKTLTAANTRIPPTATYTKISPSSTPRPLTATNTFIPPVPPIAGFRMDNTSGYAPLTVNFTSMSTGDFNTLAWSFEGPNTHGTATTPTTSFTFTTEGTYVAKLTVTGLGGSSTPATQVITVYPAPIVPVPPPINHSLLFVSDRSGNDEIYILGTDGTTTNITNNGASDTSPSFSQDGSRIAFVSNRDGNDEIYVMATDGSNVMRLTDNPADDNTPVWTSTGIVFATSRDGNYEIYLMNKDGGNPINVSNAPSNEVNSAPAPDSSKIAFMSDRDGNNEIYTIAIDGTVTNITNSPSSTDSSPSWSPDSKRLVFVSDRESLAQLYIMGVDGSNPTRISNLSKPDTHPAWSHDGSQIVFVSQDNGLAQIYVMNSDGTGVTKVSDGTGNDRSPAWKP